MSCRLSSNLTSISLSPTRGGLWSPALPGADAVRVAGYRLGVRWVLLPAGVAGGQGEDLVSDAARSAGGESQLLERQPGGCFRLSLGSRTLPSCSNGGG